MKIHTSLRCQIFVFYIAIASTTDNEYESKLTKLWSLSNSKSDPQRTAIVDVASASVLVQPTSYSDHALTRISRTSKIAPDFKKYVFKSRSIPLSRNDQQLKVEQNLFYSNEDSKDKYKTETLLPGNYIPIAEVKRTENSTEDVISYQNSVTRGSFQPKTIPLIRGQEFQSRLLDQDEEPIIEKPEKFENAVASRRSISYFLGNEDEEDEEEEEGNDLEGEFETEDIDGAVKGQHSLKKRKGSKKKQLKSKRMTRYMLPLLLAYKLKFFALIPVLIAGLILLIGATGLAGFFFALFAAVMGLQKGSY